MIFSVLFRNIKSSYGAVFKVLLPKLINFKIGIIYIIELNIWVRWSLTGKCQQILLILLSIFCFSQHVCSAAWKWHWGKNICQLLYNLPYNFNATARIMRSIKVKMIKFENSVYLTCHLRIRGREASPKKQIM